MRCIFFMCSYFLVNLFILVLATTLNEPEINDINNKLDFLVFLSFLRLHSNLSFSLSYHPCFGVCVRRDWTKSKQFQMVIKIYWLEPVLIVQLIYFFIQICLRLTSTSSIERTKFHFFLNWNCFLRDSSSFRLLNSNLWWEWLK